MKLSETGRNSGRGTFADATVTRLEDEYHVTGSSYRGVRFGSFVDVVYVGYQTEPDIDVNETIDASEMDFRLSENELHLRQ